MLYNELGLESNRNMEQHIGFQELTEESKERKQLLQEGGIGGLVGAIADLAKQLDNQIDEIAKYQSKWDTRLLGSGKRFEGFGGISSKITGAAGVSPLVTQAKVMAKVDELVSKGISYNIEQRAFLGTISDKIATTFDAANGTLLQLIRVQQADTTAARLGMENYLNTFLNSMYQTTEYLSDVSSGVKSALYEATSQMSATQGVGFEYQVQKWLGSLYSVGMSSNAIQAIAQGLGYLGSGNVSALNSNQALQNLLVMSASRAGLSYADLLTKGLDESNTNKLMQSMVEYLQQIANSNKVVQSQYAAVFGMSMSDISAARNLTGDLSKIYKTNMNYSGAMSNLFSAANSMYSRTSIGEMLSNMWENSKYSMSSGIATNPMMYAIWKAAGLLDTAVGGIPIPMISVMGNTVDLHTTIADLMRVGAMAGGILSSIGSMVAGGGGGLIPSLTLKQLGINQNGVSVLSRGGGISSLQGGSTVSQSTYIGNTSSSDVYDSSITSAQDDSKGQLAEAKEEDTSVTLDVVDGHVVDIYNLLESLTAGNALRVVMENYGLTTSSSPFN